MTALALLFFINFKSFAPPERKYSVLLLEPNGPMFFFCAHNEGTDDVGPIRDEDQGGCSTRESVLGMVPSADVDLEGRVRFFRPFHRPQ